jgi:hypothetical protein
MRLRSCLPFATLLLACLVPLTAAAQRPQWGHPHPPRAGACFYTDAGFNGEYFCLNPGDRWPTMPRGFNDKISSIRLFGGAIVQLFENGNFGGRRLRVDHDVDNLMRYRLPGDRAKSWNDRISAIAVFRQRDDWDRGHPGN